MVKKIAILGSTGSIGEQTLEVVCENLDKFNVEVLTAHNNVKLLIEQAIQFTPNYVIISNEVHYKELSDALSKYPIKVFAGSDALDQIVQMDSIDIVITAIVGFAGLSSTIKAIESGKRIALANKETLVVAGELVIKKAIEYKTQILPIDSEHSAIFQCLNGENNNPIEKIILTASGGPFRGKSIDYLKSASIEDALNHPNWNMGKKITIDSASLMNKGLEVIEAKWLFNLTPKQIEVVIHPQSIIHSIVQFEDGSMKAQMGLPDMKVPISYALSFPKRIKNNFPRFNFFDFHNLTFEVPDIKKFRNLAISFEVLKKGGNMPCIMNAANEIAVSAFLKGKIGFLEMPNLIEKTIEKISFINNPQYQDLIETDKETRIFTKTLI